ncbi:hypothetical protein HMPREF3227_01471 [Corynebacterium sp. CMW7794]|nr:hypothetical protein HMPREF3227_01471 [Corynebacterium sp. CMW7794]
MTNHAQARAGPDPCSQITDDSKELIHHLHGPDPLHASICLSAPNIKVSDLPRGPGLQGCWPC